MEYKDVKSLIDDSLEPISKQVSEIKDTVAPIPALVERLTNYRDIEDAVRAHDFILNGMKDKTGILDDIKELKAQGKRTFNWITKIAAFTGTLISIIAGLKAFGII